MVNRLLISTYLLLLAPAMVAQQWDWVDHSNGSSNLSAIEDLAIDSVRDVIYAAGYVDGNPNFIEIPNASYSGNDDGVVMKYDLNGNVEWGFLIGGTGDDRVMGIAVDESTGNFFITGYLTGSNASNGTSLEGTLPGAPGAVSAAFGSQEIFVAMYNEFGVLLWKRILGGTGLDRGLDIALNSTGVFVTGIYENNFTLAGLPSTIAVNGAINNFVLALNKTDGSILWNAVMGSGVDDYDVPSAISDVERVGITADDNGVYAVNYFFGGAYAIYNSSGTLAQTVFDPNSSVEDYVVTAYSNAGAYNWSALYNNVGSEVNGLDITNDCEGVYVTGTLHAGSTTPGGTVISSNHDDIIISKLNKTNGNEIWLKEFDSNFNHDDYFIGLHADGYGNLYAVGRLRGNSLSCGSDFNFTGGASNSEVMIAHYQTDGTFKDFEVLNSSNTSWAFSIATFKNEKYVVGGYYNNTITFGSISPQNSQDNAFVASRDLPNPFEYVSASGNQFFCQGELVGLPQLHDNLVAGGTFSGPAQVVFNDVSTGEIDLASSSVGGPYTIVYSGFPLNCVGTTYSFSIFIAASPPASFTYSQTTFCQNESNPTPATITTPGGTFSGPPGLSFVSSNTGEIDLAGSTPGTYWLVYSTSGSCSLSDSLEITISAVENSSLSYSSTVYCQGDENPLAVISGTPGGVFTGPPQIDFVSSSTGEINLSSSTVGGPYTITYTTSGTCPSTSSVSMTINPQQDASFSYSASSFCQNESNPTPSAIATPGGTFTGSSGLVVLSASGEIDLAASTAGGPYWVVHTPPGPICPSIDSFQVFIQSAPDPTFSYSQTAFCTTDANPIPSTIVSGSFSSTPGLVVNSVTGQIDLAASTVGGPYTITHLVSNASCSDSATFNVTIIQADDASFNYSGSTFCQNESDPVPTISGTPGGTFSGPTELVINTASGEVDLDASTPGGPYWVVYTTSSATCQASDSVQLVIEDSADASFNYSLSVFCNDEANVFPSFVATPGGVFSAPSGLVIDSSSGEIDLGASTSGNTYTIEYVVTIAFCSDTATFDITINQADDATFSYATTTFCVNESNPFPDFIASPGGTFSGQAGLVINPSSGEVNVSSSTIGGPYWIAYVTSSAACPRSDTIQVSIEPAPDPTFAYAQTSYCSGTGTILPNVLATPGGTFSGPAGLIFTNATTGEIDLNSSTIGGPYTIQYVTPANPCQASTTFNIIISPSEDASFSYGANHFCVNEANPFPTIINTPGGSFSAPSEVVVNSVTGEIDVAGSTTGGPYWLVYTTAGSTCPSSDSIEVYIEEKPDATFAYAQSSFCEGVGLTASPDSIATVGGTFNAPPEVVINPSTGEIDLYASIAGGPYAIEYTVSNSYCQETQSVDVTIIARDELIAVEYAASEFCSTAGNQIPVINGVSGGTFSGPSFVDIVNTTTGEFNPANSVSGGPYVISYVTNGACPDSTEVFVTILDSLISYAGEDQELFFTFSTTLEAEIPSSGQGEWSALGAGVLADAFDPNSLVSELQIGKNTFIWTVSNGVCPNVTDEVIITVLDIFIPEAVTPNNDGKNDFFELHSLDDVTCSLQIFNRWGQIVYENSNYENEWYGQNTQGDELKGDTYFYTILINDSISYEGFVVLKK